MLYNLKFTRNIDKEYWLNRNYIKEFLNENIELLQKNDIDTLYDEAVKCINEGVWDADDISDLTMVLLVCGVDFLKYTKEMPDYCFYATGITHIDIPQHITYLRESCFRSSYLKEITIPGNVKEIYPSAFFNCSFLKTVVIKEGVRNIDWGAFAYCTALKQVWLPNSIYHIDENPFDECPEDCMFYVPKGILGKHHPIPLWIDKYDIVNIKEY